MKLKKQVLFTLISLFVLVRHAEAGNELDELVQEALHHNPEILAYEASVSAARARIPQALALDDPRIGVRASNLPTNNLGLNNTPMSGVDLSISQKIPFPGKRALRKKAEQFSAKSTASLFEETRNRIRYRVTDTYFQLYQTDQVIHVVRKNLDLLNKLSKTTETRYSAGESSGPDVFRSQMFHSQLENDLLALQQERESHAIQMNTLLNRSAEERVRFRYRFSLGRLPSKKIWDLAVKGRPLVEAAGSKIEEAEQRLRLSKHDYLPDFDLMFGYRVRNNAPGDPVRGNDFISGGVTMNIPIWAYWKQSKKVQENAARKRAAEHQYTALLNESTYQAANSYEMLKRQHRQIRLFQSRLLPESRATYESSLIAYEADQADFFSTIESLRDRYEMERNYYIIRANYEISLARLKWIIGSKEELTTLEVSQ